MGDEFTSKRQAPKVLAVNQATIPDALKHVDRWVVWKLEQRRDSNGASKFTKVPFAVRTGREASTTDRGTWSTFHEAQAAAGYIRLEKHGQARAIDLRPALTANRP